MSTKNLTNGIYHGRQRQFYEETFAVIYAARLKSRGLDGSQEDSMHIRALKRECKQAAVKAVQSSQAEML